MPRACRVRCVPCCTARNRHPKHRRELNTKTAATKPNVLETVAALQTQCDKLAASRSASVIVARSPAHHKPHSSARSEDHSRIALAHFQTVCTSTRNKTPMVFHSVPLNKAFCLACANFGRVTQTHRGRLHLFDSMFTPAIKFLASQTLSWVPSFTRQRVNHVYFLEPMLLEFIG